MSRMRASLGGKVRDTEPRLAFTLKLSVTREIPLTGLRGILDEAVILRDDWDARDTSDVITSTPGRRRRRRRRGEVTDTRHAERHIYIYLVRSGLFL